MNTARPIATEILKTVEHWPEGTPIVARALLHLGTRAAVDQALKRLMHAEKLQRIGRGLYVLPVSSRFGTRPPASTSVVNKLAESTGETIVPTGASAANSLGLTTQVPTREVYLTSGRSRTLHLGSQAVELRHAASWQLLHPKSQAGQAIRALIWAGPKHGAHAIGQLASTLPAQQRQVLLQSRSRLPGWMAKHVSALVTRG